MSDGPRDTDKEFWEKKSTGHAGGDTWDYGWLGLDPQRRAKTAAEAVLRSTDLGNRLTLDELQEQSHRIAVEHGWWEKERNIGEILALIHSEISEALEEYRTYGLVTVRFASDGKPEGFFVELADAIIRIADVFEHYGVGMEPILRLKMEYNKKRPYRHGGKRA